MQHSAMDLCMCLSPAGGPSMWQGVYSYIVITCLTTVVFTGYSGFREMISIWLSMALAGETQLSKNANKYSYWIRPKSTCKQGLDKVWKLEA